MKNPPNTIIGERMIAIKPTYHEKNKHRALETARPSRASRATP